MAKRKPGFTLERHREVGEELQRMYLRLVKLSVEIGGVYPVNGPESRRSAVLVSDLLKLRSALDDALAHEQPQLSDAEYNDIYSCRERVETAPKG